MHRFIPGRMWTAVLAMVLCTFSPPLAKAQVKGDAIGADAQEVARAQKKLQEKVDKSITLDKGIPQDTRLADALEFLSDRYDMTILVDTAAFKKQLKIDDVEDRKVHLSRMTGVRLGMVLQLLARQVGGTYEVRDDYIEIMPLQKGKKSAPKKSADVWEKATKRVRDRLDKPISLEKTVFRNTPIKDALEFLSGRYDITIIVDYSAFKGEKERVIEDAPVTLPVQKNVKLAEILKQVLNQVGTKYEIIDGAILVVPLMDKEK